MPSLRFSPATSLPLLTFFSVLDLKLGSEIITYLALLNKVVGIYGLLAVFSGGTAAQVSLYLYSIGSIVLCAWGLRQISQEHPPKSLLYAHLYGLDHVVSTLYTLYFGVQWYVYFPHDGRHPANSAARKELLEGHNRAATGIQDSARLGDTGESQSDIARKALAVWQDERGFSTAVLVLGWLIKIYFILILYSFALHLRRGTLRQLLSSQISSKSSAPSYASQGSGSAAYSYSHLRNTSTASGAPSLQNGAKETLWENDEEDHESEEDIDAQIRELEKPSDAGRRNAERSIHETGNGNENANSPALGSASSRRGSERK
ncbi:MAG: hypothetical protein CYPHOPRED_005217 [Cyphobasidiales sp. Tagirdzhanova-0007]|nr:MAG: hypothetical protein CYPHOPRED_005217 [Cyphobasidiales sp. Tagirdzhanova-0007]